MSNSRTADEFGDIDTKTATELEAMYYDWNKWALDKQRPPEGDWTTWLLMGGRGSGKTRAGAEWVRSLAQRGIGPIALVGETITATSLRSDANGLLLANSRGVAPVTLDADRLAVGEGAVLARRRTDPAETPGRLALTYVDRERDYLMGTITALSRADGPLSGEATALVLDGSGARLAAERMLDARGLRQETLELELPQSMLALESGDLVDIDGVAEGPFQIAEIRDGLTRRVSARILAVGTALATEIDRAPVMGGGTFVRSLPVVTIAHLPPLPAEPARSRLVVGGFAAPWPGRLQLVDETTGAAVAELSRRATLGTTATALAIGPTAVWDRSQSLEVTIHAGHLAAVEPLAALAGSNRLATETDAGGWEVIGFAEASLISVGRYRLSGLLRGLDGTEAGTASIGRRVLVLDGRCVTLPVETHWLGETRSFRVYAGQSDLEGTAVSVSPSAAAAVPLSPVHPRAIRSFGGDIAFDWVRRSRGDGDGWGVGESPLEHVPERYELRIFNGAALLRVLDCATSSASYGSAEQVADFGALPASFTFTVAQVSAVLGAGHAAEGYFNG